MESNKVLKIKDLVFLFLPLFIVVAIQYLVRIGDIVVIFLANVFSDEKIVVTRSIETIMSRDFNQPMNQTYILCAQYILYIVVFGIWYYRSGVSDKSADRRSFVNVRIIISLIVAGWLAQMFTDCVLHMARTLIPDAFTAYDRMMDSVTGVYGSVLKSVTVILIAPIAEELLFRGLVYGYAARLYRKLTDKHVFLLSMLTTGFLFALYHGNIIQGIYAFIFGCVLCYIRYRFDSIVPAIIFHSAVNLSIYLVPAFIFSGMGITIPFTFLFLILLVFIIYRL